MGAGTFASFREALAQARARGVPFDVAWATSLPAARPNRETRTLERWALEETRAAWERAYVGTEAARPERVLALVADLFTEEGETAPPARARLSASSTGAERSWLMRGWPRMPSTRASRSTSSRPRASRAHCVTAAPMSASLLGSHTAVT